MIIGNDACKVKRVKLSRKTVFSGAEMIQLNKYLDFIQYVLKFRKKTSTLF